VVFDLHQYLASPEQAVCFNGLTEHTAHVQPLVAFFNLLDGLAVVFFAYGFDFYPLAGHFVGGGLTHAAVFGNLRQLGQARITEQGIEALRQRIAQQREGIAKLRAMLAERKGEQP